MGVRDKERETEAEVYYARGVAVCADEEQCADRVVLTSPERLSESSLSLCLRIARAYDRRIGQCETHSASVASAVGGGQHHGEQRAKQ